YIAMKKLCLLFAAASFACGASAQTATRLASHSGEQVQMARTPANFSAPAKANSVNSSKSLGSAMRTTGLPTPLGGNRWYSHFLTIDQIISQGWTASP